MFRNRYETFIITDDGTELFRSWSAVATAIQMEALGVDHWVGRMLQAIDLAYAPERSPLEHLEIVIDIRERTWEEETAG